jgi:predicted phage-related endonuclease
MMICRDGNCPKNGEPKCCYACSEKGFCENACNSNPKYCGEAVEQPEQAETGMTAFVQQHMAVFKAIRDVVNQKTAAEKQEKTLKDQLKQAMEAAGIKSIDNEYLRITYVPASVTHSLDTAKVKRKYPGIVDECMKDTPKSSYIKIEVKG